jgi:glycolate oxidase
MDSFGTGHDTQGMKGESIGADSVPPALRSAPRAGDGEGLLDELRRLCGPAHVYIDDRLHDYKHDATFMEGNPMAAVLPESTEEVAAVVRLCASRGVAVTARGSGTGLAGGPVPLAGGIVLSLERMNSIEIDSHNLCAVAGAGAITGEIQAEAAKHGLMYPPDPASASISTIGGNVACNSGGMSCLKYGVTADYVTGLTVILADGRVIRLGGRIRKRASGYRLASLFIGSEGTLGIVTEVVLKLVPLPRQHATAVVGFYDLEAAAQAIRTLLVSGYLPSALELVDRAALNLISDRLPPGMDLGLDAMVIVEQDGNDPDQVHVELERMVVLLDGADNRVAQTSAEREGLWTMRRQFGHALLAMRKNFFSEDIGVPISQIPEMVRRFSALAQRSGVEIATVGHAGDGNLHPTFLFSDEQRPLVGPVAAAIFRDAIELGGTISAEHGLGALKRDYAALEHGENAIDLMQQLKTLLDPKGILNPRKVFPIGPANDGFLDRQPGWGAKLASGRDRSELGA